MKNIIRKTICSALAAVTLSACVVVPSALNNSGSKVSVVNSMEAEAAFSPFYATVTVTGTSLRDTPGGRNIKSLAAFTPLYVNGERRVGRNYWYSVTTPYGSGWVNGRSVDKCTKTEYDIRTEFIKGRRYVFGYEFRGIIYRKSPSVDAPVAGRIDFTRIAQIERIWPTGRDGIVWGQLTNGGFLQLCDEKGRRTVEIITKEQADRLRNLY